LDEIHRLDNPSELLKIATDHFPETKVVATGSSTLGASAKFKDTLAGRKRDIWLLPMILEDWEAFENFGWDHRFIRGDLRLFRS
jgi:predicted AAA+ superfamily ATPase